MKVRIWIQKAGDAEGRTAHVELRTDDLESDLLGELDRCPRTPDGVVLLNQDPETGNLAFLADEPMVRGEQLFADQPKIASNFKAAQNPDYQKLLPSHLVLPERPAATSARAGSPEAALEVLKTRASRMRAYDSKIRLLAEVIAASATTYKSAQRSKLIEAVRGALSHPIGAQHELLEPAGPDGTRLAVKMEGSPLAELLKVDKKTGQSFLKDLEEELSNSGLGIAIPKRGRGRPRKTEAGSKKRTQGKRKKNASSPPDENETHTEAAAAAPPDAESPKEETKTEAENTPPPAESARNRKKNTTRTKAASTEKKKAAGKVKEKRIAASSKKAPAKEKTKSPPKSERAGKKRRPFGRISR